MPSAGERQRLLRESTRKYIRGEMTEEQFDADRRRWEVDHLAALTWLVRTQQERAKEQGEAT